MEEAFDEARIVRDLVEQVDKQRQTAEHHERLAVEAKHRASLLAGVVEAYVKLFPELETLVAYAPPEDDYERPTATPPRGAEAVRMILQESPDELFLVSELVTKLKERGWMPDSDNPANAVRAALERLRNTEGSDIYKSSYDGKVAYCYRPDELAPQPPRAPRGDPEPTYDYGEEPF